MAPLTQEQYLKKILEALEGLGRALKPVQTRPPGGDQNPPPRTSETSRVPAPLGDTTINVSGNTTFNAQGGVSGAANVVGGATAAMLLSGGDYGPAALKAAVKNLVKPHKLIQPLFNKAVDEIKEYTDGVSDAIPKIGRFDAKMLDVVGAGEQIKDILDASGASLELFGLKASDSVKILEELRDQTNGSIELFRILERSSPQAATELTAKIAAQATALKAFGVDAKTIANMVDDSFRGVSVENFDVGIKRLNKMTNAAMHASKELNIPFKTAVGNLTTSFEDLAIYGLEPQIKNFAEMETLARRSGISLENLYKVSGQFNTIESAADAIGTLNAVLKGTNLDFREMIAADPSDAARMYLEEIKAAVDDGRYKLAESGRERYLGIMALVEATGKVIPKEEIDRWLKGNSDLRRGLGLTEDVLKRMDKEKAVEKLGRAMIDQTGPTKQLTMTQNQFINSLTLQTDKLKDFVKFVQDAGDNIRVSKFFQGLSRSMGGFGVALSKLNNIADTFDSTDRSSGLITNLLFGNAAMVKGTLGSLAGATNLVRATEGAADAIHKAVGAASKWLGSPQNPLQFDQESDEQEMNKLLEKKRRLLERQGEQGSDDTSADASDRKDPHAAPIMISFVMGNKEIKAISGLISTKDRTFQVLNESLNGRAFV